MSMIRTRELGLLVGQDTGISTMAMARGRSYRKALLTLVALLSGGTSFTSCDSRVKTAVVSGLETTFLSLFDPANYLPEDGQF